MSEDALASQSDCSIRSPIHISTCVKMLCAGLPKVVKQMITAASVAQTCWDSISGNCHRKDWPTTFTLQQWRCLGHVRHIHAHTHDIDDKLFFENRDCLDGSGEQSGRRLFRIASRCARLHNTRCKSRGTKPRLMVLLGLAWPL